MQTDYPEKYRIMGLKIAYYRKKAGYTQEAFAEKLIDLIENVDEVLSAKNRFMDAMMG